MPETTLVITDTSCLIVLTRIGALDVLHRLYAEVTVTDVIAGEFGEPLPEWLRVRRAVNTAYQQLLEATLDPGEASAIALAMETDGALLVVDDLKGRREAQRLGLRITGTLGVLYKAKEMGIVPQLAPLLALLQQEGFRIAPAIIDELLHRAGEA
jgi:predicted nucleic acid-binding protein